MPRGASGRIVIEVDPELKERLYRTLDREGLRLKEWFVQRVDTYLYDSQQLSLRFEESHRPESG